MHPLEHTVMIPAPDAGEIEGDLRLPGDAAGVVVFAHGSGSSRHSPRNRMVATRLNEAGFGTLSIDLLTGEEEAVDVRTAHLRFDIGLLADRLLAAGDAAAAAAGGRTFPSATSGPARVRPPRSSRPPNAPSRCARSSPAAGDPTWRATPSLECRRPRS